MLDRVLDLPRISLATWRRGAFADTQCFGQRR